MTNAKLNAVPANEVCTPTSGTHVQRYAKAFKEWEQVKDFTPVQLEHPGRRTLYDRRKEELDQARGALFSSQPRFDPAPLWSFIERDSAGNDCLDGQCLQDGAKLRVHFPDGSIDTVCVQILDTRGAKHAFARGYLVKAVLVVVPLFGLKAAQIEEPPTL